VQQLTDEHGAGMGMPVLGQMLAGDYPRARTGNINDRCGVHFPQLSDLFMRPRGDDATG
jgi:hypothetical protein